MTTRFHVHFETRADKPTVFHMTDRLIAEAKLRNRADVATSLGTDLEDLSWLSHTTGLVTSNDVMLDPRFPMCRLAEAAPNLHWIHIIGAGIEPLAPFEWLPSRIALTNNSGVHYDKARESAMMALLMLNARVPSIFSNQRKARWEQIFTPRIRGRLVLVIGVGDMGAAVAHAARDLGLRVIGVRRSGRPHPLVEEMFSIDGLDRALPQADFVVLAAPLTRETRLLLDRRRIGMIKRGAGFLNLGRAGSVDHAALVEALQSGALSGAVIDVFETEPLPSNSRLWYADNLLLMPHVTSDDIENYMSKTLDLVFENVRRLQLGEPLANRVDPTKEY